MKTDFYTKAMLTLIALALIGNLLKPVLTPSTVQAAGEGKFSHVQLPGLVGGLSFFDTKTGDIWLYNGEDGKIAGTWKLVELGKPLQVIKKP